MPAGSAKGERRGGRQKGTPNKRAQRMRDAQAAVAAGIAEPGDTVIVMTPETTPLNFLLTIMRTDGLPWDLRFDAAKAAAPYVHPKLSSVEMEHGGTGKDGAIVLQITPSDAVL